MVRHEEELVAISQLVIAADRQPRHPAGFLGLVQRQHFLSGVPTTFCACYTRTLIMACLTCSLFFF